MNLEILETIKDKILQGLEFIKQLTQWAEKLLEVLNIGQSVGRLKDGE